MSLHDHERLHRRLASVADPIGFLINLFSHAPVGFAVWTADGHAVLTNRAFMDLFLVEPPPEQRAERRAARGERHAAAVSAGVSRRDRAGPDVLVRPARDVSRSR
jgi:hypothetical protein